MTEILIKNRRLSRLKPEDPALQNLPEYHLLKALFEEFITKTRDVSELSDDIEGITLALPPSIQKLVPSKPCEAFEAEYKAFEERFLKATGK